MATFLSSLVAPGAEREGEEKDVPEKGKKLEGMGEKKTKKRIQTPELALKAAKSNLVSRASLPTATFFLNGFDDLLVRPRKSIVFQTNDLMNPIPCSEFISNAVFMSRSMKLSMLLYRELVIPATWLFNNPLVMALSVFPHFHRKCNSFELLSSELWRPSFDPGTSNFRALVAKARDKTTNRDDPSAWWYDVYIDKWQEDQTSQHSGADFVRKWVFEEYASELDDRFLGVAPYHYDGEMFSARFIFHLREALAHFNEYGYGDPLGKRVREWFNEIVSSQDTLWMGKVRQLIASELHHIVPAGSARFDSTAEALADFTRHAYLIAHYEAHKSPNVVYSLGDRSVWKSRLVENVDRRLAGYLIDEGRRYGARDVFQITDVVQEEHAKRCKRLRYLAVPGNLDLVSWEDIFRQREEHEEYFGELAKLQATVDVFDSIYEVRAACGPFIATLAEYLEDLDALLGTKDGVSGRRRGLDLLTFLALNIGVRGGGTAVEVCIGVSEGLATKEKVIWLFLVSVAQELGISFLKRAHRQKGRVAVRERKNEWGRMRASG